LKFIGDETINESKNTLNGEKDLSFIHPAQVFSIHACVCYYWP